MNYPNVIIAGAPKCATTSLYYWLSQHPKVCSSIRKETYYLMDKNYPLKNIYLNYHKDGIEGYRKIFPECLNEANIFLEATPDYLYQKTAIQVLSSLNPLPSIYFLLRKPSMRIFSL